MITEADLTRLEAKHKRIKHVVYNGVDLVFRKPTRSEVQLHRAQGHSESLDEKTAADEFLAQMLIVRCGDAEGDAARPAFTAMLEEYGYLVNEKSVGRALSMLTGVVQDDNVKSYGLASKGNASPSTNTPAV